ncbi:MAG TPA: Holliday junction resolvase RuvX [Gemmatimonadota bacterium]|nr:Holliday junction resolvase RuvX [Gemmatimonadota bacterium]
MLAIDYGERRVGLALAEPGVGLVRGLPTLDRRSLKELVAAAVARVAVEQTVGRIVLGVPYRLDGTEGPAVQNVRAFAAELAARVDVPIEEWDERLSSGAARARLRELGYSERDMRERLDQLSAVLMLEGWLRRRQAGEASPESAG